MKIPIPDDWNEEDWHCIEVLWPDSPSWTALLIGFLSQAARGRFWDERTGSVKEVQEIGRNIFDANFPFIACCGEDNGARNDVEPDGALIDGIGECYSMDCSIPFGTLRWNDGVLQYRYCGEWHDVPGSAAPPDWGDPGEGETPEAPDPPFEVATACSKALKWTGIVFDIIDIFSEAAQGPSAPWDAISDVKNAYPGISFGDLQLLDCYLSFIHCQLQDVDETIEDPGVQKTMLCRVVDVISAGNAGMTEAEYDAARDAVNTVASNLWSLATYPTVYMNMRLVYIMAMMAIGPGDSRKQTTLAMPEVGDDCSCPGGNSGESANGWYWGEELQYGYETPDQFQTYHVISKVVLDHDVYGLAIAAHQDTGEINKYKRNNDDASEPTYDVFMFGSNSDTMYNHMDDWWLCTDPDSAHKEEIEALLSGVCWQLSPAFASSKVVASPSADKGKVALAVFGFGGPSGTGTGTCKVRWLYNKNSASHQ